MLSKMHRESAAKYDALRSLMAAAWDDNAHGVNLDISDHAVVRFIERFGNCDMAEVRRGIAALVELGRPEVVLRDRTVITILPEGAKAVSHHDERQDAIALLLAEARALVLKSGGDDGPI